MFNLIDRHTDLPAAPYLVTAQAGGRRRPDQITG
jgi:hypothetical protein